MILSEPILLLITVYVSFVYGILYLFFESYPISFQEERGWSAGLASLPFLGLMIGVLIGSSFFFYNTRTRFIRKCKEAGRLIPEERLVPMMFGSVILPAGLFWFAWTSSPHINPAAQIIAGIPIGCGLFLIFMPGTVYLVDVYLMYAASALSANTFLRSMTGGAFPLFATAMYHNLGVNVSIEMYPPTLAASADHITHIVGDLPPRFPFPGHDAGPIPVFLLRP